MTGNTRPNDTVLVPEELTIPFVYSVGTVASRFYVELRDKSRITGVRCPQCNRVYVPPRLTCGRCFVNMDETIQLEGKGTLLTYTVVHYSLPIHLVDAPFAYGIVQLDGADTGLTHFIGEMDLSEIRTGMRVEPVFNDERTGDILDIKYFRPLK